eukprot:593586-Rhodomonas_salina.3
MRPDGSGSDVEGLCKIRLETMSDCEDFLAQVTVTCTPNRWTCSQRRSRLLTGPMWPRFCGVSEA